MVKKCVICGKEFKCSPSDKKVTCSKECSQINKSKTHKGKRNVWSKESRQRLKEKGQTENLKKGTEAAQKSFKSGRFETNVNAKIWVLTSPEGKEYVVKNLSRWARENCELFGFYNTEYNAVKISSGLKLAKYGGDGKEYANAAMYKGWKCRAGTDIEYMAYKIKHSDVSVLSEMQLLCLSERAKGFPVKEIAAVQNMSPGNVYRYLREAMKILNGLPISDEKNIEYARRYYLRNRENILAKSQAYKAEHREEYRIATRKYYNEHRDELILRMKKYNKKYYQENKEHILEKQRNRKKIED